MRLNIADIDPERQYPQCGASATIGGDIVCFKCVRTHIWLREENWLIQSQSGEGAEIARSLYLHTDTATPRHCSARASHQDMIVRHDTTNACQDLSQTASYGRVSPLQPSPLPDTVC
eukprot:1221357-Amphidinium_carterae.1